MCTLSWSLEVLIRSYKYIYSIATMYRMYILLCTSCIVYILKFSLHRLQGSMYILCAMYILVTCAKKTWISITISKLIVCVLKVHGLQVMLWKIMDYVPGLIHWNLCIKDLRIKDMYTCSELFWVCYLAGLLGIFSRDMHKVSHVQQETVHT